MALSKIQAESMNLADTYAFSGTVSGTGKVLQIEYGNHTALTTYSNSFVDLITINITPSVATSLILIRGTIVTHHIQVGQHTAKLVKSGGASGSDALNYEAGDFYHPSGTGVSGNISIQYVDDHNTTNQITYKIQIKAQTGSGVTNKDYDGTQNGVSSLVAMEIAT